MNPAFTPTVAVLLVLLGVGVGTFGTLVGVGGGFLLAPILLIVYPEESPQTITAISLAVVFANALDVLPTEVVNAADRGLASE